MEPGSIYSFLLTTAIPANIQDTKHCNQITKLVVFCCKMTGQHQDGRKSSARAIRRKVPSNFPSYEEPILSSDNTNGPRPSTDATSSGVETSSASDSQHPIPELHGSQVNTNTGQRYPPDPSSFDSFLQSDRGRLPKLGVMDTAEHLISSSSGFVSSAQPWMIQRATLDANFTVSSFRHDRMLPTPIPNAKSSTRAQDRPRYDGPTNYQEASTAAEPGPSTQHLNAVASGSLGERIGARRDSSTNKVDLSHKSQERGESPDESTSTGPNGGDPNAGLGKVRTTRGRPWDL